MTDDPVVPLDESTRKFYATYVDVVQYGDGGFGDKWATRHQWVIMPPLKLGGGIVSFYRRQVSPTNRSVWKGIYYSHAGTVLDDVNWRHSDHAKREIRGPITVEITRDELETYVGRSRPKTPWKVLERAQRFVTFKI